MKNLSMVQALEIWSELESAYYGQNGFGGDTAELYAYRFYSYSPSAVIGKTPSAIREQAFDASGSLHEMLFFFKKVHEGVEFEIDGLPFDDHLDMDKFPHRIHLRVIRKKRKLER
jgi:hypothetical protein